MENHLAHLDRNDLSAILTTDRSPVRGIGCCGAYCRPCAALADGVCKGCKGGYDEGIRDITKAKCMIKVCCFRDKRLETCADCETYPTCEKIHQFHSKEGYKYQKYRQSIEFIRKNGYTSFLRFADTWKRPYGTLR
jgi:hypothetical protein